MFKFLFKLGVIIVVIYALIQIPFFRKYYDQIVAGVTEKTGNVSAEYDRVKGVVDNTVGQVKSAADTAVEVKNQAEKVINDVAGTVNKIDNSLNGGKEKADTP
jgi:hypothetical protein